ncbi:MAG: hypothetical protein FD118_4240 [Rhodocyclaceae bacterium]|nr:MAG: hypothetical protein FD118_4240 [Rhodocyclaceae bacterium]
MTCADPAVRKISEGGERTVAPFAVGGDNSAGRIVGCFVLAAGIGVLHVVLVGVVKLRRAVSFKVACGKLGFPSRSIVMFSVLFQGIALNGVAAVVDPSSGGRVVAAVLLLVSVAVPIACLVWVFKHRPLLLFAPYKYVFIEWPSWIVAAVPPRGTWTLKDGDLRPYSSLVSGVRDTKYWLFWGLPYGQSLFLSIVVTVDGVPCWLQSALITTMFLVTALLIGLIRPYRMGFTNVMKFALNLLTGLVAAVRFLAFLEPAVSTMVLLVAVLSMVATCGGLTLHALEHFSWKKQERQLTALVDAARTDGGVEEDDSNASPLLPTDVPVNPLDPQPQQPSQP